MSTIETESVNKTLTSTTGLEELEMGAARIQVDDKKIINCRG